MAPIDDRYAHFITVQALSDMAGAYHGTLTFDGYPRINDDNESFDVESQFDLFTVRDSPQEHIGAAHEPDARYRMHPGNAGFPAVANEGLAVESVDPLLLPAPPPY